MPDEVTPAFSFSRDLEIRTKSGTSVETGAVQLHLIDEGTNWKCRYVFCGIPYVYPESGHIYGADALQAKLLCLKLVRFWFEEAAEVGIDICWTTSGDFGGIYKFEDNNDVNE